MNIRLICTFEYFNFRMDLYLESEKNFKKLTTILNIKNAASRNK